MALKIFDNSGLTALGTVIKRLKQTADGNTSAVSGLSNELSELASQISTVLSEVNGALEALESGKQDKAGFKTVALPVSGWSENTDSETRDAGYAYAHTVIDAQATVDDIAETIIFVQSMNTAAACGLCTTADVLAGKIRYYAVDIPTTEIIAQVRLIKG